MTRFGCFLFNIMLIAFVYGLVYWGGARHDTLLYAVKFFSAPHIAANFMMSLYALIRWFMTRDFEISREGVTFLYATWIASLATFIAYVLVNGDMAHLFT
jgi:hypothetical protein